MKGVGGLEAHFSSPHALGLSPSLTHGLPPNPSSSSSSSSSAVQQGSPGGGSLLLPPPFLKGGGGGGVPPGVQLPASWRPL